MKSGPTMSMLKITGSGAQAAARSWSKMYICFRLQPAPPYSFGQLGAAQPLASKILCQRSESSRSSGRPVNMARRRFSERLAAKKARTSFLKARSSAVSKTSISLTFSNGGARQHQCVDRQHTLGPGNERIDVQIRDEIAQARGQKREACDGVGQLVQIGGRALAMARKQGP